MTCRDYSLDLVQSSFLQRVALPSAVLPVPPLSDEELDAVVHALPDLTRPLANARLRVVLKNPYFLDKAAWMLWPEEAPLPQDERAFREKFWHNVVREDHDAGQGFPQRREQVFIEVALRRARSSPTSRAMIVTQPSSIGCGMPASCLHPVATDRLVAPAHDVLEDWALLFGSITCSRCMATSLPFSLRSSERFRLSGVHFDGG